MESGKFSYTYSYTYDESHHSHPSLLNGGVTPNRLQLEARLSLYGTHISPRGSISFHCVLRLPHHGALQQQDLLLQRGGYKPIEL